MRVLVFGGREYQGRAHVFRVLSEMHAQAPITLVITGSCTKKDEPWSIRGADRWAEEWAREHEVAYIGCPAKWRTSNLGKGAGFARNRTMFDRLRPAKAVGFPGGNGTASMWRICVEGGVIPRDERTTPLQT